MGSDIRGEILYLIFKELGIRPSVSSFEKRKLLQKLVFIAQRSGIRLNFSYNWYRAGPYSPTLTPFYYDIADKEEDYEARTKDRKFSPLIADKLTRIKKVLGKDIENGDLLVAMASLLYWEPESVEAVMKHKPGIPLVTWQEAKEKLKELGLA